MNKNKIIPNKDYIETFMNVLFSRSEGYIALRSFAEKGSKQSIPPTHEWLDSDTYYIDKAYEFTKEVAKERTGCYVIPGTVDERGRAKATDVVEMQTLLIDIDEGDTEEKLRILTAALDKPTLIVESGGITSDGHRRLHVYWQLLKPASGDDLKTLLELRYKIALAVGGDVSFKSAHQPIRIAGSVYYKNGQCRLVKIRKYEPYEYDLSWLVGCAESLPDAPIVESLKANSSGNKATSTTSIQLPSLAQNKPFEQVLTTKVHEGAVDGTTRFASLQRVIGYWLCRYHDGVINKEKALEEIVAYNEANVVPPWPDDKLQQMVNGIWKKHVNENGEGNSDTLNCNRETIKISSYPLSKYLTDNNTLPNDIIAPRILTPSSIFVFGGAPKVGKSDFLLSLFAHLAAGKEFLGFKPPRPLRIFYFQAEIGYHYLRERLQSMKLPKEITDIGQNNLHITPNIKLLLNEAAIDSLAEHILSVLPNPPDIIAVDPIRNVFDGGKAGATENDNDAMLFFLQQRIERLRDKVNPDSGIILVHHTKKLTQKQFDEEPFSAFSGASSLRGYYSSGAILRRSDINPEEKELIFELRNGIEIPPKILKKKDGQWCQENAQNRRIARKKQGSLFDRERERRVGVILSLLEIEALKGKFYLIKQFAEKFRNTNDLGNKRSIQDDCSAAATQGLIKFFDNPKHYGLNLENINSSLGFMCIQNMRMYLKKKVNAETGEISEHYIKILPTHYKRDGDGRKEEMINPQIWEIDVKENEVKDIKNEQ